MSCGTGHIWTSGGTVSPSDSTPCDCGMTTWGDLQRKYMGQPTNGQTRHAQGADDDIAKSYRMGRDAALKEASDICESVRAQWATCHSVAPSAAAQCKNMIDQLRK